VEKTGQYAPRKWLLWNISDGGICPVDSAWNVGGA